MLLFRPVMALIAIAVLVVLVGCRNSRPTGEEAPIREHTIEELVAESEKWPVIKARPELYQLHGIMAGVKEECYAQPQGELLWRFAHKVGALDRAHDLRPGETLPRPKWRGAEALKAELLYPHVRAGFQPSADQEKGFVEYLKKRVNQPGEVGLNKWEEARLQIQDKTSLLYYHSHLFLMEDALSKPLELRGPWSPDPDYWPKYATWVLPYRRKAIANPWSEEISYRVPELSPQSSGYLLEALRCGAREYDLPIIWNLYCDTPGNTPENLRRAYYTAIARGAKQINFCGAVPKSVAQSEHSIGGPGAEKMWRTLQDLVRETAQFEKVAYDAKPRRPDVALLISFAQDLWDPDPDRNHERKCIYLASRIGGYNMEFITEEEIQAGKYKHLRAIVTTGNHLERATARELLKFINTGGSFACFGYAGFRDEHNRPMDILNDTLGVTTIKEQRKGSLGLTKQNLPGLLPVDTVNWTSENAQHRFYAYSLRNSYEARKGVTIYGRYASDKSPMTVSCGYGKGITWVIGTFMASSFIRDGLLPPRPWKPGPGPNDINNFLPTAFNFEVGDLVTAPWVDARYDALFNKMMVEPVVMEGPNGVAVIIVNWNPTPQDMDITVQYAPDYVKKATSIARGDLKVQRSFKSVTFKLRVDVADVVLLTK